jgi:endonuclease V-like protein UPF0215 family
LQAYKKLGPRHKVALGTSSQIYIRNEGCTVEEASMILNDLTLQGAIPEPLRVAQLLAKTML